MGFAAVGRCQRGRKRRRQPQRTSSVLRRGIQSVSQDEAALAFRDRTDGDALFFEIVHDPRFGEFEFFGVHTTISIATVLSADALDLLGLLLGGRARPGLMVGRDFKLRSAEWSRLGT